MHQSLGQADPRSLLKMSFTAPENSEHQWEIGFRLCWGLFKWLTSVHRKSSSHGEERGRNCNTLQLWVLLATGILEEKASQIVLRDFLCLSGQAQLNTFLHVFKIHRAKCVK